MYVSELYLYIFYFFSYGWLAASEQLDLLALFQYHQNNKTIMIFKTLIYFKVFCRVSLYLPFINLAYLVFLSMDLNFRPR